MKKSTKKFVLSTETVNSYGFRVLTSGIDLERFRNNPTMLWMHKRPTGEKSEMMFPLGYWTDIEVKNNVLYGTPVFDDSDAFAMGIYHKVENGTLRMASAGLLPVEWSETDKLAGQTKPTLKRSVLEEVSIVDIGSNPDALATALYNSTGNVVNLSSAMQFWPNMPIKGKDYIVDIQKTLSLAYREEKITYKELNHLISLGKKSPNDVVDLLNVKRPGQAVTFPLLHLSWDELFTKGDSLSKLKKYEPEIYQEKFFSKFGKYPQMEKFK